MKRYYIHSSGNYVFEYYIDKCVKYNRYNLASMTVVTGIVSASKSTELNMYSPTIHSAIEHWIKNNKGRDMNSEEFLERFALLVLSI